MYFHCLSVRQCRIGAKPLDRALFGWSPLIPLLHDAEVLRGTTLETRYNSQNKYKLLLSSDRSFCKYQSRLFLAWKQTSRDVIPTKPVFVPVVANAPNISRSTSMIEEEQHIPRLSFLFESPTAMSQLQKRILLVSL